MEVKSGKERLRYVSTIHEELSVMILGVTVMRVLSVHNWDTPKTYVDMLHVKCG